MENLITLFGESKFDETPLSDEDLDKIECMVRSGELVLVFRGEYVTGLIRLINECRRLNNLRKDDAFVESISRSSKE